MCMRVHVLVCDVCACTRYRLMHSGEILNDDMIWCDCKLRPHPFFYSVTGSASISPHYCLYITISIHCFTRASL